MIRSVVPAVLFLIITGCDSPLDPAEGAGEMAAARVSAFEPGKPLPASTLQEFVDELQLTWLFATEGLPLHDTFVAVSEEVVSIFAIPHRGNVADPAFEDSWSFGKRMAAGRLNNPGAVAQSVASQASADLRQHLRRRGYVVN